MNITSYLLLFQLRPDCFCKIFVYLLNAYNYVATENRLKCQNVDTLVKNSFL